MSEATASAGEPTPARGAGSSSAQASSPARPRGIQIADSAVKRLLQLLEERRTPEAGLRIAVKGGGCSGLSYFMEWAERPRERDKIFERDGVRIFVDPKSYLYLLGTELAYEDGLMQSGFKLQNPNAKVACGCGDSFTV